MNWIETFWIRFELELNWIEKSWIQLELELNWIERNELIRALSIITDKTFCFKQIQWVFCKCWLDPCSSNSNVWPLISFLPVRQRVNFSHSTDQQEIRSIILNIKNNDPGHDGLSAKVINPVIETLLPPLTYITNFSFTEGVFPHELKIAQVLPLYKNNDPMLFNNYRPISILPLLSKLFERLMYNRLIDFIEKETIEHSILSDKLYHYGIRGHAFKWFSSYLTKRYQCVNYNNTSSDVKHISCGVQTRLNTAPIIIPIIHKWYRFSFTSPFFFSFICWWHYIVLQIKKFAWIAHSHQ